MMLEPNITNEKKKMARIRLSVTITADTIQLKELDILANNTTAVQLQSTIQNFIDGIQKQIKENSPAQPKPVQFQPQCQSIQLPSHGF